MKQQGKAIRDVQSEQGVSTISSSDDESDEEDHRTIRQMTTTEALKSLDELLSYSQNQNNESLCKLLSEAISKVEDLKLATCKQTKISSFFKA